MSSSVTFDMDTPAGAETPDRAGKQLSPNRCLYSTLFSSVRKGMDEMTAEADQFPGWYARSVCPFNCER